MVKTLYILKFRRVINSTFIYLTLILISTIALVPIIWVVLSSFRSNIEILSSGLSLPTRINLRGYIAAFKLAPLHLFFFNSIIISVASTLGNVFILSMAAYVLARFHFRFRTTIIIVLSTSLMIPMTALMLPVYMVVQKLGLYDTRSGLWLVYTALGLPMSLLILRSYFLTIPKGLEEAAEIDGAGFFQTFIRIILPISQPGLASAAVLQFLLCWNEFIYALVLTSSLSSRTLPLSLSYFTSQFTFNYTAMFAAVTITILPSITIFAIFQEMVVSNMAAGALKG